MVIMKASSFRKSSVHKEFWLTVLKECSLKFLGVNESSIPKRIV